MAKFIMLCGITGSGKSTIAAELATLNTAILSSDAIREELWGSEDDQQSPAMVFQLMQQRTIAALKANKDVIYDATNLNSKRRAAFLKDLRHRFPELNAELHIVLAPLDVCIAHQQLRARQVPSYVVYKQAREFMLPDNTEHWNRIIAHNESFRNTYLHECITAMNGVSQTGPWHQETVDKHALMVSRYAESHHYSKAVRDVAYIHDIGKPLTRTVDDKGHTHFYAHENVGAYLFLCGVCRTGEIQDEDLYRASLIQHHMDMTKQGMSEEKIIERIGLDMYKDIKDLHEADENGAVREDELANIHLLKFMNAFDDWESRISAPPYNITVKHDGDYVLMQYSLLDSDMRLPIVQECRGSIFRQDETGTWMYVCRPFDKFFNYGEGNAVKVDWDTARVLEKVDGSLMKMFFDRDEWHLATNGTINAFNARVADLGYSYGDVFNRALGYDFNKLGEGLDKSCTYMFELTSPDTQLVIAYDDAVWYLSRRNTKTGEEYFDRPALPNVRLPKQYFVSKFEDVIEAASKMSKDEEGFVVNDAQGHRVKVKSPEYLIAAHLSNNKMVSNRNIVIYIQEGKIDDFLAYCPQYTDRVMNIIGRINAICAHLEEEWDKVKDIVDTMPQKEFAALIRGNDAADYLFDKRKNRDLDVTEYFLSQRLPTIMRAIERFHVEKEEPCIDDDNEER